MANYYLDLGLDTSGGMGTSNDPFGAAVLYELDYFAPGPNTFYTKGSHTLSADVLIATPTSINSTITNWIDGEPWRINGNNQQYTLFQSFSADMSFDGGIIYNVSQFCANNLTDCYVDTGSADLAAENIRDVINRTVYLTTLPANSIFTSGVSVGNSIIVNRIEEISGAPILAHGVGYGSYFYNIITNLPNLSGNGVDSLCTYPSSATVFDDITLSADMSAFSFSATPDWDVEDVSVYRLGYTAEHTPDWTSGASSQCNVFFKHPPFDTSVYRDVDEGWAVVDSSITRTDLSAGESEYIYPFDVSGSDIFNTKYDVRFNWDGEIDASDNGQLFLRLDNDNTEDYIIFGYDFVRYQYHSNPALTSAATIISANFVGGDSITSGLGSDDFLISHPLDLELSMYIGKDDGSGNTDIIFSLNQYPDSTQSTPSFDAPSVVWENVEITTSANWTPSLEWHTESGTLGSEVEVTRFELYKPGHVGSFYFGPYAATLNGLELNYTIRDFDVTFFENVENVLNHLQVRYTLYNPTVREINTVSISFAGTPREGGSPLTVDFVATTEMNTEISTLYRVSEYRWYWDYGNDPDTYETTTTNTTTHQFTGYSGQSYDIRVCVILELI
jgi:hypothetical protein